MYLYEFPKRRESSIETLSMFHKTFDDLISNKIPNENFNREQLRNLIKTIIANQITNSEYEEEIWSWAICWNRPLRDDHEVNNVFIFFIPSCLSIAVLKAYLDRFEENNEFEQDIIFAINRGLRAIGKIYQGFLMRNRNYIYKNILLGLKILINAGVQDYILENYSEFPEIQPIFELFSDIRKDILSKSSLEREIVNAITPFELLPLKNKNFFQYRFGQVYAIIEAPYTKNPKKEVWTKEIATEVAFNTGCNLIIGNVSSQHIRYTHKDSNEAREILTEYNNIIRRMLSQMFDETGAPVLHIILRGISERFGKDFEICTKYGASCRDYVQEKLCIKINELRRNAKKSYRIGVNDDPYFNGGSPILKYLREGWRNLNIGGYGEMHDVIEIRLGRKIRNLERSTVADLLSEFINGYQNNFNQEY